MDTEHGIAPSLYKTHRRKRGTLKSVAAQLGVDWTTVQRREAGRMAITQEAWLALLNLPLKDKETQHVIDEARAFLVNVKSLFHKLKRFDLATYANAHAIKLAQIDSNPQPVVAPQPLREIRRGRITPQRKLHLK